MEMFQKGGEEKQRCNNDKSSGLAGNECCSPDQDFFIPAGCIYCSVMSHVSTAELSE